MPRLGESLIAAGLLTVDQVEQGLRAQVMWGGRLGTNLIELGFLDLDVLSRALGRQHRLPAALARHFDKSDATLQDQLSPNFAERFSCIPLLRAGPELHVVVASISPLESRAIAIVADELAIAPSQVIPAIAAELRIRYHLERVYKIPRKTRFLRSPGKTNPPFPVFEIAPVAPDSDPDIKLPTDGELPIYRPPAEPEIEIEVEAAIEPEIETAVELVDDADDEPEIVVYRRPPTEAGDQPAELDELESPPIDHADELAVPTAPIEDPPSGRERRKYVRTVTDEGPGEPERATVARIAIRRAKPPSRAAVGNTLGEATRAIRRGVDRDSVGGLAVKAIDRFVPECASAILLIVRGEVAISWKGFSRKGGPLPELAIPLDQAGLVQTATAHNTTARSPSTDLGPVDQLLLAALLGGHRGDLIAVPVSISGQVMCVIAMVTSASAELAGVESVAAAMSAAFARLMRDASR
jgi:hypothetical protein